MLHNSCGFVGWIRDFPEGLVHPMNTACIHIIAKTPRTLMCNGMSHYHTIHDIYFSISTSHISVHAILQIYNNVNTICSKLRDPCSLSCLPTGTKILNYIYSNMPWSKQAHHNTMLHHRVDTNNRRLPDKSEYFNLIQIRTKLHACQYNSMRICVLYWRGV